jgi:phosphoribosylaminoimidazolecarboxamide formyltransferase/IMP cyclohydrolase
MVRSSAKNYAGVAVVTDPADYPALLAEMASNSGELSLNTRFALAKKAFVHTARYDSAIANWLTSLDEANQPQPFPDRLQLAFDRVETLRYGENPHQQAAFYRDPMPVAGSIANYRQLQGKELSYNNIADADAAWECVKTFATPACVIIKHANPCGVAVDVTDLLSAYEKAFQTDSTSAFGGIIAFNGTVDADVVAAMNVRKHFVEVLLAPAFTDAAREMLATSRTCASLNCPWPGSTTLRNETRRRRTAGADTRQASTFKAADLRVVSKWRRAKSRWRTCSSPIASPSSSSPMPSFSAAAA